jgi:hypothetical protein
MLRAGTNTRDLRQLPMIIAERVADATYRIFLVWAFVCLLGWA